MIYDDELDGYPIRLDARPPRHPWQITVVGLMRLMFGVACVLIVIRFLMPVVNCSNPEAARRAQCVNNLKQIGLALHGYHQQYGVFPPAYIADADGRPMHNSWRVLILPFLDEAPLYGRYDFAEPWDGPHNTRLLANMPNVFSCPSRSPAPKSLTSYVAITGPGTMFPGTAPVELADITDRLDDTLMLAEVATVVIPWTAPVDLDASTMSLRVNGQAHPGISSQHPHGASTAFGDGHVYFWEEATPVPRAVLTIAGGDGPRAEDGILQPK